MIPESKTKRETGNSNDRSRDEMSIMKESQKGEGYDLEFKLVLPNVNHETGQEYVENRGEEPEESHETTNETGNETINETVNPVEDVVAANPGVKIIAIVAKSGKEEDELADFARGN